MKTATITHVEGYTLTATARPIDTPPGRVHLQLTSTWAGAKDPNAVQKVLDITLDAQGAQALAQVLEAV
jgi:hypothetical protein